jgi:hypothetical protein
METNTANERTDVYVLQYSAEQLGGYINGIFSIYATEPRAKNALRQLAKNLIAKDFYPTHQDAKDIYLLRKVDNFAYHLFIERKEVE